jgi:hypothetical protein
MAKVFAAETAMTLATQAVQMHGGYGYAGIPGRASLPRRGRRGDDRRRAHRPAVAIAARLLGEAHA